MSLKGNKERWEKLGHILAAFLILIHAYEKYDMHHHSYVLFLIAGIVFSIVAVTHHRLAKIFPYVDGVFFVIEAIVYAVIAADYFDMGKKGLPWCYVLAAIGYLIVAFVKGKKGKAKHSHAISTEDNK